MVRCYNIYTKSIIQYGGCTRKIKLKDKLLLQTKVLRNIFFKNRRHPSDERFERSRIMNIYDIYVFEHLKYAAPSTRGKSDEIYIFFKNYVFCIFYSYIYMYTIHILYYTYTYTIHIYIYMYIYIYYTKVN